MNAARLPAVTLHAITRFREHHPEASDDDLRTSVALGIELSVDLANSLLGRPLEIRRKDSSYMLAADRRGIFALKERGAVVVTYLRFGPSQEAFALKNWPMDPEG